MGMSTYIIGFVSPENENYHSMGGYKKHSKVLIACIEAGISELPKETAEYFGSKYPEKYLLEEKLEIKIPKHKYSEDMKEGFEIIISEIPDGVHKIRFVNSW
jgi:hypothetical protein